MPSIKVFPDLGHTVFDILDATNRQGRTHFVKPSAYLPRDVSLKTAAALREVLECTLQPHYLFTSRAKGWPEKLEVTKEVLSNGDWLVGFNAAKFFFMPGDKPNKELKEVRKLFEAMKPFYEANANLESPGVIRLMNERDSNGRVYGSFKCIGGGQEPVEFTPALQSLIDTSPALTLFMRNTALALGKIGRYSWCDMREEHLYSDEDQPWRSAFYKRAMEKRQAEAAAKASAGSTSAA